MAMGAALWWRDSVAGVEGSVHQGLQWCGRFQFWGVRVRREACGLLGAGSGAHELRGKKGKKNNLFEPA